MRTVLSLTLPARGLTPVTCGLALCPGRDSLAFPSPHLPPGPASLAGLVVHFLPGPAVSGLQHPWPLPTRPAPRRSQFFTQTWGFVRGVGEPPPTAGCGQEISTLAPSSPWDLQQVTASCWASSPVKQAGLVQTLQKALSRADS